MDRELKLVVFKLMGDEYGFEIDRVREIRRIRRITRIGSGGGAEPRSSLTARLLPATQARGRNDRRGTTLAMTPTKDMGSLNIYR